MFYLEIQFVRSAGSADNVINNHCEANSLEIFWFFSPKCIVIVAIAVNDF